MDITGHSLSTTLVSTEEARLLRTLMEHSRVAMAVATRAGEISYLNPAVTLRYGRKLSRATSVEEFIRFATPDAKAQENALLYWKSNISDLREDFPHADTHRGTIHTPEGVTFHFLVLERKVYVIFLESDEKDTAVGLDLANGLVRESEDRCRALFGSTAEAFVIVGLDGRIRQANHAFESIMGYSAHELAKANCIDLMSPEGHGKFSKVLEEQVLTRGYSDLFESACFRKDGAPIRVELLLSLIRDKAGNPESICSFVREKSANLDSSEVLQSMAKLLENRVAQRKSELSDGEIRFRQINEISHEGIAITENGVYVDANAQLAEFLGCTVNELIGRPVIDFVAESSRGVVLRNIETDFGGSYECLLQRANGTTFYCEVRGKSAMWHGRPVRITVLRDLSERKEVEARLASHREELTQAHQRGVQSEIFAGIVHQISQPVSAMGNNLAAAKILQEQERLDSPRMSALINELEIQLERIRATTLTFRTLIKPEQQSRDSVDVNELLRNALHHLSHTAEFPRIRFNINLHRSLPAISASSLQLEHAFLNIIQNAIEATTSFDRGEKTILITSGPTASGGIEIRVTDSGPGIPNEVLSQLFDPFFSTKKGGTGMGLALAQRVIMSHGGKIQAGNNPKGAGSVFHWHLPPAIHESR